MADAWVPAAAILGAVWQSVLIRVVLAPLLMLAFGLAIHFAGRSEWPRAERPDCRKCPAEGEGSGNARDLAA